MTRLPKITVQGWTADGPAYTVHREIAGFRNRKARRAGTGAEELVGDHDGLNENPQTVDPAAYMVMAAGGREVHAFKAGHVYQVTLLVDGDALDVLVDAREGDRLETYGADLQLLEQRALDGDELEAALADGPEQAEGVTALTGAQVEPQVWVEVDGANVNPDAPFTDPDGDGVAEGDAEGEYVAPAELTDAQVDDLDTAEDEAAEAARDAAYVSAANELYGTPGEDGEEPSTGEADYEGTVADFVELVEAFEVEELEAFAATDSRKGVREAAAHELDRRAANGSSEDDEDAVGGDGSSASDEEE